MGIPAPSCLKASVRLLVDPCFRVGTHSWGKPLPQRGGRPRRASGGGDGPTEVSTMHPTGSSLKKGVLNPDRWRHRGNALGLGQAVCLPVRSCPGRGKPYCTTGAPVVSTGIQVVIASVVVGHQTLSREGKGCGKGPSGDAGERNVPRLQRCHRCRCCPPGLVSAGTPPCVLLSSRCLPVPLSAECGQEGIGVEQAPCLGMAGRSGRGGGALPPHPGGSCRWQWGVPPSEGHGVAVVFEVDVGIQQGLPQLRDV